MFCRICNKEIDIPIKFFGRSHLTPIHNITTQNYYDKYIKKENEGICICGKMTKYYSFELGYAKYCSYKCSNKFNIENIQNTVFKKYGVKNISQVPEIKNKKLKTLRSHEQIKYINKKIFRYNKVFNILDENNISFINEKNKVFILECNKCHNPISIRDHYIYKKYRDGHGICPTCTESMIKSFKESDLLLYIQKNYTGQIVTNSRDIIPPYELDIYLPELKLAFEFNGLFWHNEDNKNKNYHKDKSNLCESKGIHLVHIWEDLWDNKPDIIKSRILNLLGKTNNKIAARKCTIKQVQFKDTKEFLNKNHTQGWCISKINLGLYFENELVSIMTFGNLRRNMGYKPQVGIWELLRFCNKLNLNIIGGAGKLLNEFIEQYKPNKIISYADRAWTGNRNKNLYTSIGFSFIKETNPNYFYYTIEGKRCNRFVYRKSELIKLGYDSNLTENKITQSMGLIKVYDSGQFLFEKVINTNEDTK